MSATDKLTQIRTLLGLETKLEQMKLENGTILEADKFENDQPVFILTEDQKVALPIGNYKMENGLTLSVEKEGVIAKLAEAEEEVEEVAEEVAEEVSEEETEDLGYVSREEFNLALEEIKKMIDDLKPEEKEEEKEEEEVEEAKEEVEEMSDEKAEIKAELSKPASAPLKHNPEATTKKSINLKYGQNRKKSTFDIILEKLNK